MHEQQIERLIDQAKSIVYFLELNPNEQKKLWPLLTEEVKLTIELLEIKRPTTRPPTTHLQK